MQRRITTAIPLVLTVLAVSCSSTATHDSLTQPTAVSAELSASFSAASPSAFSQVAESFPSGCPTHAPFRVPIGLIVRANRDLRVFVIAIRMRFRDPFFFQMPQVTLPAPELTRQFGTNLVLARSARTFPLNLAVGCGTGRKGTAAITVDTEDEQGSRQSGQVTVAVQ